MSADLVEAAHQTAARYPAGACEFAATGLPPEAWQGFGAPQVAEAPVKMAMRQREHQQLAANGTHLVVGERLEVALPRQGRRADGSVDLAAAGSVAPSGLESYYRAKLLKHIAYAKPGLSVDERP